MGGFASYHGWQEYSPYSILHNSEWDDHIRHTENTVLDHSIIKFCDKSSCMLAIRMEDFGRRPYDKGVAIINPICVTEDKLNMIEKMGNV